MILLDTHVLIWLAGDSEKLSQKAKSVIKRERSAGRGIAISSVTLFEAAQVIARGRAQVYVPLEEFLYRAEQLFIIKPIHSRIAIQSLKFQDPYPKDPMDRIIGATALVENMALITADERIRSAGAFETIW